MGEKKLVIVCILALVIIYTCMQGAPGDLQDENLLTSPPEGISTFSEPEFDSEPCGGGGGDDVGGGGPL